VRETMKDLNKEIYKWTNKTHHLNNAIMTSCVNQTVSASKAMDAGDTSSVTTETYLNGVGLPYEAKALGDYINKLGVYVNEADPDANNMTFNRLQEVIDYNETKVDERNRLLIRTKSGGEFTEWTTIPEFMSVYGNVDAEKAVKKYDIKDVIKQQEGTLKGKIKKVTKADRSSTTKTNRSRIRRRSR